MDHFMIYLAGPMDGISDQEAHGWREQIAIEYPNILFFMPHRAYANSSRHTALSVDHMNRHAINCSSGLLANLIGPGRGFGTIREIEFARMKQKRVAIAADERDIGQHTLLAYDIDVQATITDAMNSLLEWLTDAVNQPPTIFGFPFNLGSPGEE